MKNYTKTLVISLITLVILNLGTLGYIIYTSNCPPGRMWGPHGKGMFSSEKLHLTPEQENKFNQLRDQHHDRFIAFKSRIDSLRKSNLELLKSVPFDSLASEKIISQISLDHKLMERQSREHFLSIRALLTKEQLPYFNDFINDLKNRKHPGKFGDKERKEKTPIRD